MQSYFYKSIYDSLTIKLVLFKVMMVMCFRIKKMRAMCKIKYNLKKDYQTFICIYFI